MATRFVPRVSIVLLNTVAGKTLDEGTVDVDEGYFVPASESSSTFVVDDRVVEDGDMIIVVAVS